MNKCIPEPWEDDFGGQHETESHDNPPDTIFCEQCGAPTAYYPTFKILKLYEELLSKLFGGNKQEDELDFF